MFNYFSSDVSSCSVGNTYLSTVVALYWHSLNICFMIYDLCLIILSTIVNLYWHSLQIYVLCLLKAFFNANDDCCTYFNVCRCLIICFCLIFLLICTHIDGRSMFDNQHNWHRNILLM